MSDFQLECVTNCIVTMIMPEGYGCRRDGRRQGSEGELIIAGSDSAELLEFEEEGFHEMSFYVKPPIDEP